MGTPVERGSYARPTYQRTALEHERIRSIGVVKVSSAIAQGAEVADMGEVLGFYKANADVFVPPTPERAEEIFHKDVAIARRFDEGVQRVVNVYGFGVRGTFFLGDLIAETRGRILEVDAQLAGIPAPTAEDFNFRRPRERT